MNYGRYFRLNQTLSKVVSGVAIYDYIDLPAYFGPSEQNPMSPKYPISMTITADAVCFRLHYSAFKIEKRKKENDEPNEKPRYAYTKEDLDEKAFVENNMSLSNLGMAHMEEVILELPYINTVSKNLSDTIKDIYSTTFPLVEDENTSMGGRFLEQIIRKRFPSGNDIQSKESTGKDDTNRIEDDLYKKLREISDNTASYSSLWLMDLYKGDRIDLYKKDNNDLIVGFLRKLLLDFMFDLKHSDVFQNSACYQQMYSGLMSDFFFSALMHKCEYYYYRKLINDEIRTYNAEVDSEKKNGIKERIIKLYVEELSNAEKTWSNDVMSPKSELLFGARQPAGNFLYRMGLSKSDEFRPFPSWFAEPEEEMRRICFPMKEKSGEVHICNIDTLKEFLGINTNIEDGIEYRINAIRIEMREKISRWFLKRYDFDGAVYFHLSKPWNRELLICLLAFCICLFVLPCLIQKTIDCKALKNIQYYFPMIIGLVSLGATLVFFHYYNKEKIQNQNDSLDLSFKKQSYNRIKVFFVLIFAIVISINDVFLGFVFLSSIVLRKEQNLMIPSIIVVAMIIGSLIDTSTTINTGFKLFVSVIYMTILVRKRSKIIKEVSFYLKRVISYLHLFLPRLVASITAAWITLTVGFDLYAAFFDSPVSWPTGIFIGSVVLLFIMYEINRIASSCSVGRKILRSVELLMISYTISLIVGIVVIDFVGARFVDRGGIDEVFEKEYEYTFKNKSDDIGRIEAPLVVSKLPRANELAYNELIKSKIIKFTFGEHDLLYMRDFLFMFAFIAMFIGIFLQMIIFEEKQMTEL